MYLIVKLSRDPVDIVHLADRFVPRSGQFNTSETQHSLLSESFFRLNWDRRNYPERIQLSAEYFIAVIYVGRTVSIFS